MPRSKGRIPFVGRLKGGTRRAKLQYNRLYRAALDIGYSAEGARRAARVICRFSRADAKERLWDHGLNNYERIMIIAKRRSARAKKLRRERTKKGKIKTRKR